MPSAIVEDALRAVGEELKVSVSRIAENAALPQNIRSKAPGWAAHAASELLKAGRAKADGDDEAHDAAMREVDLVYEAGKAVGIGQIMLGLDTTEAEARARLSEAITLGINIGTKLLIALL